VRFRYSPASVWMRMERWLIVAEWMMPTSSPLARSAEYVRCSGEGSLLVVLPAELVVSLPVLVVVALGVVVAALPALRRLVLFVEEAAAESAVSTGMASMLLSLPPLLLVPARLSPLLALLPLRSTPPAPASLTYGLFLSSKKYFTLKLSRLSRTFFALRVGVMR